MDVWTHTVGGTVAQMYSSSPVPYIVLGLGCVFFLRGDGYCEVALSGSTSGCFGGAAFRQLLWV
jgi:hypothetical protein